MNKKKSIMKVFPLFLVLLVLVSGCTEVLLNFSTTYESYPTKISYVIKYGYDLNCTGSGEYQINYDCNIPTVLQGSVSYNPLYEKDYQSIQDFNNNFLSWNISSSERAMYKLGIRASVIAESFIVEDLTGIDALTIDEIAEKYPETTSKYLNGQSNDTTYLINPYESSIVNIAQSIMYAADTNNSFICAKEIFNWLKTNTEYTIHEQDMGVQPALLTLQKKTGDCDDLSFLYISLCRSVGIPARFVRGYLLSEDIVGTVKATAHVWVEVFVGGLLGINGWIPVECAGASSDETVNVHQNFGVESAYHLRLFVDEGSNESLLKSSAGISFSYGIGRHVDVNSFAEIIEYSVIESKQLVVDADNQRYYQE
ncbi:MAG: transglutaminase domain-containing protein [Thermoplasmatota archaeon]